jgi:hypothetical protein
VGGVEATPGNGMLRVSFFFILIKKIGKKTLSKNKKTGIVNHPAEALKCRLMLLL